MFGGLAAFGVCTVANLPVTSLRLPMKSAYELAMERLAAKDGALKPLTPAQKEKLADLDTRLKAKLAEREITVAKAESEALARGESETAAAHRELFIRERLRLEEECEVAKQKIRDEK